MALYSYASARRSVFDTVLYRALSQVATVLGYVVLVRGMSRQDFGVFNLLYAFIPVVGTVASLGLEQTLRRYQPEYLRAGNKIAASWLVRVISSARLGTTAITIVLVLLTWNFVAPVFKVTPYRAQFILFSVLLVLHFQVNILQASLASRMLHKLSVGSLALLAYVKLIGYVAFVTFGALTLVNAIIVDTLGYAVAYTCLKWAYRRQSRLEERVGALPSREDKKRMLRYGLYNNFNDAGTLILSSRSDNFFIAAFIDPLSVAVYSFYTRLSIMAEHMLPERMFRNVVQPLFFAIAPADADQKLPRYFSFLLNVNLAVQWPILAFATVYHAELVRTAFGGKYVEDSWLLPLVLLFATINLISVPATLVAQYKERAGTILLSKIFTIYNVGALVLLIPWAGVYGAAIATGTAALFKNLFIWWFVRHQARWINFRRVALSSCLIWGGAVAVSYLEKQIIRGPDVVHLVIGLAICAVGSVLYLRSAALSPHDREILGNVLRGKEAWILRRVGVLPARNWA
jgi:O-antigen/teichoic acid export membrane protein